MGRFAAADGASQPATYFIIGYLALYLDCFCRVKFSVRFFTNLAS